MLVGLVSNASSAVPIEAIKAALPICIGLASVAYLTMKISSNSSSSGGKVIIFLRGCH
jgi:hypothetical protein